MDFLIISSIEIIKKSDESEEKRGKRVKRKTKKEEADGFLHIGSEIFAFTWGKNNKKEERVYVDKAPQSEGKIYNLTL